MSDDLVTWLRAQLDEDERVAREAEGGWITLGPDPERTNSVGRHAARHDPARILAEVAAKRKLVELAVAGRDTELSDPAANLLLHHTSEIILSRLAQPYVDRPGYRKDWDVPDYRDEWRP